MEILLIKCPKNLFSLYEKPMPYFLHFRENDQKNTCLNFLFHGHLYIKPYHKNIKKRYFLLTKTCAIWIYFKLCSCLSKPKSKS